ncbi:MAG: tetratricopeptide repeat protein [Planctomycetota bacterium]|nr:tetratricopeptide repeat protein [Planctomycetota bacterium]
MGTVMFSWELGAGVGHMAPYRAIAETLLRNGHRVVFALRDLSRSMAVFQDVGITCIQAPIKTAPITKPILQPATYAQMLHNLGYETGEELAGLVRAWRSLYDYVRPDLAVFDHSPTAMLAARGLPFRKVAIGIGFLIPPDVYPLPNLRPWRNLSPEQLRIFEDGMLDRVNRVLDLIRAPRMERLGRLFGEMDEQILTTFRELDHYPERLGGNYWGLCSYFRGVEPNWPGEGKRIFAYLKNSKHLQGILQALQMTGQPALVVPDGLPEDVIKKFASETIRFDRRLYDLKTVGREHTLSVHNANHGTMVQLLLAGKPALLAPLHLEQLTLAKRTEQLGVGLVLAEEKPEEIAPRLQTVLNGAVYQASAKAFAERYKGFDPEKQGERLYAQLETHLAAAPKQAPAQLHAPAAAPARPVGPIGTGGGKPPIPLRPGPAAPAAPRVPADIPVPELLKQALALHQAGRLRAAEPFYARVVELQPRHADAWHQYGILKLQLGDPVAGGELIQRAIGINANVPVYHANHAEACRMAGRFGKALGSCEAAARLDPKNADIQNIWGLVLLGQGKDDMAAERLREAVRLRPEFGMAHNNLANALRGLGDEEGALRHYKLAVQVQPQSAEARSNLGQYLLEQGDIDGALEHGRRAVELKPGMAAGHSNYGNALREKGDLEEAQKQYREAIRLEPRLAMPYNNMAQAKQEEGLFDEALEWYRQALALEPNSARFYTNLASLLNEMEREEEALQHFRTALRLDPKYVEAHNGLGALLRDRQEHEEARQCFRKALDLRPSFATALVNLAELEEEMGRLDEAEKLLREALRLDADHRGAHAQLAMLRRKNLPDADVENLRRLLDDAQATARRGMGLHYALAQVYDARKEYEKAAEHLVSANALRKEHQEKRNQSYAPPDHELFADNMIRTFTPEFFAAKAGLGSPSERPVFVVGLPRSSTTLTEQILCSHSRVFGAGERRFARESFEALPGLLNPQGNSFDALPLLDAQAAKILADQHLEKLAALDAEALRVVDKMPDNYLYLGLLAIVFPKARFIHCRRDLRDTAVSCWMTNFRHIRWACDFEHIATRFTQYDRLMKHWRKVLPMPFLEIDYEETVEKPEEVSRRLIDWIGMPWEDACLEPHKTERPVRTASVTQVREPIYKRSVARWKNYEKPLAELFARLPAQPGA